MNRTIACVVLLLVAAPALAWGDRCEFTARREVTLDARTAERLAVITGAGDLTIRGEPGLTEAVATAKACASTQELLDAIKLTTGEEAGIPTIRAEMPKADWSLWGDAYAYLDLQVRVPAAIALRVEDSSGDVRLEGVAAAEVDDSSGDLDIRAVRGLVQITDSSGDIQVQDAGSVLVSNDSSGDLEISNIRGDAKVEEDSSGDIEFDDVAGDARVESDSSGEIDFTRVRGSAIVDHDSSGSVHAANIGGDFIVRSDGSGSVSHRDVAGRVEVPDDD